MSPTISNLGFFKTKQSLKNVNWAQIPLDLKLFSLSYPLCLPILMSCPYNFLLYSSFSLLLPC